MYDQEASNGVCARVVCCQHGTVYPTAVPVVVYIQQQGVHSLQQQKLCLHLLKGRGAGGGVGQQLALVHSGMSVVC